MWKVYIYIHTYTVGWKDRILTVLLLVLLKLLRFVFYTCLSIRSLINYLHKQDNNKKKPSGWWHQSGAELKSCVSMLCVLAVMLTMMMLGQGVRESEWEPSLIVVSPPRLLQGSLLDPGIFTMCSCILLHVCACIYARF